MQHKVNDQAQAQLCLPSCLSRTMDVKEAALGFLSCREAREDMEILSRIGMKNSYKGSE